MTYKKRRANFLSPPVDYWFFITIFLTLVLVFFSFLLIKERLFLKEMSVILSRYKLSLDTLSELNSKLLNSHLSTPTTPFSSNEILYLQPQNFSLRPSSLK